MPGSAHTQLVIYRKFPAITLHNNTGEANRNMKTGK